MKSCLMLCFQKKNFDVFTQDNYYCNSLNYLSHYQIHYTLEQQSIIEMIYLGILILISLLTFLSQ